MISQTSQYCFYASRECAFVWKCVTHTKELRAAWPSWCCCHADMEPSESPGEPKPCRDEISALLREYSVKTKAIAHKERARSHFSYNALCQWEKIRKQQCVVQTFRAKVVASRVRGEQGQTHQPGCRRWACRSRPGPVGVSWGWWQTLLESPKAGWTGSCLSSVCSAKHRKQHRTCISIKIPQVTDFCSLFFKKTFMMHTYIVAGIYNT